MRRIHRLASSPSSELEHGARCSPEQSASIAASLIHGQCSISIFDAAATGDVALMERLHQAGADLFSIADDGSGVLHAATRATSAQVVQYLLSAGLEPIKRNEKYRTPLQEAALLGNWEAMSVLLRYETGGQKASEDAAYYLVQSGNLQTIEAFIRHYGQRVIDQGRQPLLHMAAEVKNLAVLRLLLGYKGLKINEKTIYGRAVIHIAVKIGNTQILRLLLAYPGLDVNVLQTIDTYRESPLNIAIRFGHEGVVRALLAHEGIEFAKARSWPEEEIRQCMKYDRHRIGQILLEDDRVQNNDAVCPLLLATVKGEEDEVIELLQQDAAASDPAKYYLAPLNWAIALGHSTIAKRLMEDPATDVNRRGTKSLPIEVAAATGDLRTLQALLDHPRIETIMEKTVYKAVRGGHISTLELLLSRSTINPNISEPLLVATQRGSVEMVKMLLDCPRIDVNHKPYSWSETALFAAVRGGNLDIIWLFLKHETQPTVDINATAGGYKNLTVLDIAAEKNATEIVEILRSFGAKTGTEVKQSQESQTTIGGA
jgi:ankyrin repeat protein